MDIQLEFDNPHTFKEFYDTNTMFQGYRPRAMLLGNRIKMTIPEDSSDPGGLERRVDQLHRWGVRVVRSDPTHDAKLFDQIYNFEDPNVLGREPPMADQYFDFCQRLDGLLSQEFQTQMFGFAKSSCDGGNGHHTSTEELDGEPIYCLDGYALLSQVGDSHKVKALQAALKKFRKDTCPQNYHTYDRELREHLDLFNCFDGQHWWLTKSWAANHRCNLIHTER